jgi:hypothetical protein
MDVGNDDSPNCYGPEYSNVTEHSIIDFFETAVLHDLQFPTYKWLEEGGIVPSNKTGVALSDMLDILTERSGAIPYVCLLGAYGMGLIGRLDVLDLRGIWSRRCGITPTRLVGLRMGRSWSRDSWLGLTM